MNNSTDDAHHQDFEPEPYSQQGDIEAGIAQSDTICKDSHVTRETTSSLSERVRQHVARLLLEGRCTHHLVAAALDLHPRTLQRHLKKEGESFESIKDSVRREVALRYLRQPKVSLVRVTEILGYSETSVLSRSCNRWFATTPRKLRKAVLLP